MKKYHKLVNVLLQSLHGVEANMLDCDTVASELELQLHYYDHFQTNTHGKSMNHFIPDLRVPQLFFYKDVFGIR